MRFCLCANQNQFSIYGGNITAAGGQNGAGIGSGLNKGLTTYDAGTISIYGGNITATAGKNVESDTALNYYPEYYTAGIGGGNRFGNCTVNIYGGNITANCYRGSFTSIHMGIGGTNEYGIGYGIRGQATLSYSKPTDSIYATNYGGTVTIADGKTFRADGTEISGAVESVTVSETVSSSTGISSPVTLKYPTFPAIDNKTLTPPNVYTVNIGTEGIIASSAQAFPNETVTLSPAAGYNLTDIKVNGTAITGNTFTMPEHDVTVTGTLTPITYTITYELNGGTATNPTTYTVETKTFTLNNPTKSGYTFDGWGNVHAETITIKKGSTGDRSYTANWVISYTVKFNANGGTGEMSSQGFTYDTAQAITGNTFTREGYTFAGWNTESDGSGTSYNDGQEVSNLTGEAGGVFTLYAQWTAITYNITYNIDGGTLAEGVSNPATYTVEDAITLTNPTKGGYIFTGWTESYNADGSEERPYVISGSDGWELLCDALNDNDTWNRFSGKYIQLSNDITVTRMAGESNHDFMGTLDGGGYTLTFNYTADTDNAAPFSHTSTGCTIKNLHVAGTITTSAKYAAGLVAQPYGTLNIENCRVSVTINSTVEGDGTHGGFVAADSATLIIRGCVFDGKMLGENTNSCGGFVGWRNATADIYDSVFAPSELTIGTANSATFARNSIDTHNCYYTSDFNDGTNYTGQGKQLRKIIGGEGVNVSLSGSGTAYNVSGITAYGSGMAFSGDIVAGEGDSVGLGLSAEKIGYTLTGYTASAGTLTENDGKYSLSMPDENVTITAEFEAVNYGVGFDEGITDGLMTSDKGTANYGDTVTLTVKAGYEAKNVSVKNGDTVITVTSNADGTYSFTMPAGAVTVEADITPISYTITYELDGGTVAAANPTTYTVETATFTLTNPTKDGYTFAGWTGTGLSGATMSVEIAKGSMGDRSYTATWKKTGGKSQEDDPTKPTFAKHSLTLDGEIGVNFYMNLPPLEGVVYTDTEKCYMEFDINGSQSNVWQYCNESFKFQSTNYYGFRCFTSSVQMADTIIATLHYGNNLTISQDYSVKEYTDAILENGSFSAEVNNLMVAIQDYGHFAQLMLSKANNWTIGEEFTEMPGSFTGVYDKNSEIAQAKDGVKDFAIERDTGDSGIERVEMRLLLDSKTTINLYLHVKDSHSGEVSATLDGGTSNVAKKLSDKKYLVQIMNIPVHELGKWHTIEVTAGMKFNVRVAALSYVHGVLDTEAESIGNVDIATMQNAVTALYRYYDAAMKYKASITQ